VAILVSSTSTTAVAPRDALHPEAALRIAWFCWLGFLALPFVLFLYVVWSLMDNNEPRDLNAANGWFVASMVYLIVVVPLAIFWRSRLFRAYWTGECVSPKSYLIGMISVWLTLEIGGIFSLIGCLVTGSLLPNLLPALVTFMLFTPLWPSGRAMICSTGNTDDPEAYEEPR
jgi:hypothetical protein